jgi:hypothetical protein
MAIQAIMALGAIPQAIMALLGVTQDGMDLQDGVGDVANEVIAGAAGKIQKIS